MRRASSLLVLALAAACAAPHSSGGAAGPAAMLAGTAWRVAAVNQQATPREGDYFLRFETDGRVSAKFGCNGMGGMYRVEEGALVVGDLAQTLIGCPEPSATFERQGSAVLGQPMTVTAASDDRVTLSNARGSIALEAAP